MLLRIPESWLTMDCPWSGPPDCPCCLSTSVTAALLASVKPESAVLSADVDRVPGMPHGRAARRRAARGSNQGCRYSGGDCYIAGTAGVPHSRVIDLIGSQRTRRLFALVAGCGGLLNVVSGSGRALQGDAVIRVAAGLQIYY